MDQIKADLQRFQSTGELPDAWAPEIDDEQLDEINRDDEISREFDAIESGSVEPPKGGWLISIKVRL
jgi:hypothetical protein